MISSYLNVEDQHDRLIVGVRGDWIFDNVLALEDATASVVPHTGQAVTFQCDGLDDIDIAGAWVLYDRTEQLSELGIKSELIGFKAAHFKFLQHIIDAAAIREYEAPLDKPVRPKVLQGAVENLGRATSAHIEDLGEIARSILDGVRRPSLIMIGETIKQVGRSGSAFAAAIGVMKLNEEVDAMRVLGLNPNQMLIVPRILGLVIALPVLTIFADIAGIAGGALIAVGSMGISGLQFIERVAYSTDLTDFYVGMSKAPIFALLIAAVGTLRGMQVKSSAEELGLKTTTAVVQSIFMIIVADALFATLFTRLGI